MGFDVDCGKARTSYSTQAETDGSVCDRKVKGKIAELHTRWQQRHEARTLLRATRSDGSSRRPFNAATKQLQGARAEDMQRILF